MASATTRYVDDTDPMKFSIIDDGVARTDLADAHSITLLAISPSNPSDNFTGALDVLDPVQTVGADTWNVEYAFADGDTAAAGNFNMYATVTESDTTTIATYALCTLTIKTKT